jgi:hypothetical protein
MGVVGALVSTSVEDGVPVESPANGAVHPAIKPNTSPLIASNHIILMILDATILMRFMKIYQLIIY